jgi:hypothetical protein
VEVLARLLGHESSTTTEFYFKVRDKRALAAAKTIPTGRRKARAG